MNVEVEEQVQSAAKVLSPHLPQETSVRGFHRHENVRLRIENVHISANRWHNVRPVVIRTEGDGKCRNYSSLEPYVGRNMTVSTLNIPKSLNTEG